MSHRPAELERPLSRPTGQNWRMSPTNAAGRFRSSTAAELAQIYANASFFQEDDGGFTDITSGACGIGPDFDSLLATEGWDFCTGVGSPLGYFGK
jgi:hypothetical protein